MRVRALSAPEQILRDTTIQAMLPVEYATEAMLTRILQRAAGIPPSPGNQVRLLIDGEATYHAMHQQIASATQRVHLENYIIRDDQVGRGFAAALIDRAQAGVTVRVLYDWLGSFGTPRAFWRMLREGGVQIRAFSAPQWRDPLLLVARDHRKVLVVDGWQAVTGGLCLGEEWVADPAQRRLGWRDTAIAVTGSAADELDRAFARAWRFACGELLDEPPRRERSDVIGRVGTTVQVVASEPGRERASRAIDLAVESSSQRLWVTEAYLALPQRMYQALRDAAQDGVDVRLLLPGTSDLPLVQQLSRAGYRTLLRSGVRIWEWAGPMLHAKTMVVDGRLVRIGSSNLNVSSLLANWELDLFVEDDPVLAGAMEEQFLADLARSDEITLRPWRRPLLTDYGPAPFWLDRSPSRAGGVGEHHPAGRERLRRVQVTTAGLIRGARAAIFGPIALLLLVQAVLFVLFPQPMAWVSATLSALLGLALLVRARGHRVRA